MTYGKLSDEDSKLYVGDAGAGMVKVYMRKDMVVVKSEIDHTMFPNNLPKLIEDLSFISDLFTAATNQAIEKIYADIYSTQKIDFSKLISGLGASK